MGRHETHDALRGQNTARTREATYYTSKTSVAGDTAFFSLFDEDDAVWGTRPTGTSASCGHTQLDCLQSASKTTTTKRLGPCVFLLLKNHISKTLTVGLLMAERDVGSARRRRERRLRSWPQHERMTVRMELAAALHHSSFRGAGPETPRRSKEPEDGQLQGGHGVLRAV